MTSRLSQRKRTGRSRRLLAALTAGAIALGPALPTPAQAQKQNVSPEDRREAKRLFNKAHLAYRRGDYEEAILKWEQSYDLSGEPLIFLSIANAYERLGDAEEALDYLKRWREKAPRREHEELDGRIESLERRVAEKKAEGARRKREEEQRKAEQQARRNEKQRAQQAKLDEDQEADSTDLWTALGWTMVGAGAAAVVAGVIVDGVAAAKRPDEGQACLDTGDGLICRAGFRDDIESSNRLAVAGDVTWIIGGIVAASGVVVLLTLAGGEEDEGRAARLSPWLGPTGGGVAVSGRF